MLGKLALQVRHLAVSICRDDILSRLASCVFVLEGEFERTGFGISEVFIQIFNLLCEALCIPRLHIFRRLGVERAASNRRKSPITQLFCIFLCIGVSIDVSLLLDLAKGSDKFSNGLRYVRCRTVHQGGFHIFCSKLAG